MKNFIIWTLILIGVGFVVASVVFNKVVVANVATTFFLLAIVVNIRYNPKPKVKAKKNDYPSAKPTARPNTNRKIQREGPFYGNGDGFDLP